MTLGDWAHVGEIATPVIAFFGLIYAGLQLRQTKIASYSNDAYAIYRTFLTKTLENPDFIEPSPKIIDLKKRVFGGSRKRFLKYEVYVDLMLATAESLLGASEHIGYMGDYIYDHKKYIDSKYFEDNFGDQTTEELDAYMKELFSK